MGTKTMHMDRVETNAGIAICADPSRIDCSSSLPVSRLRLMFSMATVASSTRMPTANAMPPRVTPRVTGFVGGGTQPVPLSADEVNSILYRQASSTERPRPKTTYERNDGVRIVDGPFANFRRKVDEVNTDRGTLRVMVMIFGRATPVELEFLQVEKE